ncbi:MAG: LPS export ABC transporter periplasmic protein LptC [Spirochaetales bacterium]|nr:LPS export ABC transporter periplasmic protein LptC [Spirochaetales bacterium]
MTAEGQAGKAGTVPRLRTSAILHRTISLVLLVLLASCSQSLDDQDTSPSVEPPDAVFTNVTRTEYRNGQVALVIHARSASWFDTDRRLEIEGLAFTSYDNGKPSATGQADHALLHEDTGDIDFSGFVTFSSADGEASFETERLTYRRALERLETSDDTPVLVKGRNLFVLSGQGLLFDIKNRYFELKQNVQGTIAPGN